MKIYLHEFKGKEVFWYDDPVIWKIIIGVRGGPEYKIDKWTWVRNEDTFRRKEGRNWTEDEAFTWAFKYAMKESQYVDFEEVPSSPKAINLASFPIRE